MSFEAIQCTFGKQMKIIMNRDLIFDNIKV